MSRTVSRPAMISARVRWAGMSGWMPTPTHSRPSAKLSCLVYTRAAAPPGSLNLSGWPTGRTSLQGHGEYLGTHSPLRSASPARQYSLCVVPNGFDDDTAAKEWDKHWPEIGKAHSLILDLRENGGGSDSVGAHILATLSETPLSRLGLAFASIAFRAGSV
jgi:hypothetical protein